MSLRVVHQVVRYLILLTGLSTGLNLYLNGHQDQAETVVGFTVLAYWLM